jgi:hypothetical protein
MNDPMARSAMFAVAEGYEQLADRAETAGTMVDIDSFLLPPD